MLGYVSVKKVKKFKIILLNSTSFIYRFKYTFHWLFLLWPLKNSSTALRRFIHNGETIFFRNTIDVITPQKFFTQSYKSAISCLKMKNLHGGPPNTVRYKCIFISASRFFYNISVKFWIVFCFEFFFTHENFGRSKSKPQVQNVSI